MTSTLVPLEANPPGRPPLDRPQQAYHPECGIVDSEDAARVLVRRWTLHRARSGLYVKLVGHSTIMLHRFVLDLPQTPTKWDVVDHINKDGLDCRRSNLRIGSNSHNLANSERRPGSSRFKGVTWDASRSRWMAQIVVDEKHRYLGRFKDEVAAARAYNAAAFAAWGEFAFLNDTEAEFNEVAGF